MDIAEKNIARYEAMRSKATNWMTLWDECARYICQRKGDILTKNTPGQEQTQQVWDTTAEDCLNTFAAGLLAQLTPPGEAWFRLQPSKANQSEEFKAWLGNATDIMLQAIYASNFYLAWHEDFLDLGTFGTSCTYLEEGKNGRLLNFCNIPVGTFFIAENSDGLVDTVFREWKWTARQAEQEYGLEALGKMCKEELAAQCANEKEFTFIHAVYPRRKGEWKDGQVAGNLRRFASVIICKEDKHVVLEDGYYELAHFAGRLMRSNNEVYGRGPGTQTLPEIKLLNRMEMDLLLAVELEVNPTWLMPDDSAYRPDNRPNGITYWDATNPNNKPEQLSRKNRVDLGEQKTEQKRARLRTAFFVDMFQMLTNPAAMQREKTAFEVAQMVQEKLVLFSPIFARIVQEKLNPLLERVFGILVRSGVIPPPPADSGDMSYEIAYTSKIALAIKAAQNNALLEVLNIAGMMVPFDQSVGAVVDWGKAFRDVCQNRGLPSAWMRSEADSAAIVAQQQQAAQAQQQAMMMQQTADAVGKLGPDAQKKAVKALGGG